MTGETPAGDGTFAPPAQDRFADPLSGLVSSGPVQNGDEYPRLRVAGPVQPDASVVREMVNAALLAESGNGYANGNGAQYSSALPQPFTPGEIPVQQPLGMLPQQRTWPVRTPQILRQAKWPKGRAVAAETSSDDEEVPRKRPPSRKLPTIRIGKPSSNSAGVIVAVVLMIVFVIVAIQLLASLFGSIAGIFS